MQTALVVEDDPPIRHLLCELLLDYGFNEVVSASTPDEAITLAAGVAPELVVLDHILGAHSGIEVAERLRALPGFHAPVLVTTALPKRQAEAVCEEAEACECLPKPFDITEFLAAVDACLSEQKVEALR